LNRLYTAITEEIYGGLQRGEFVYTSWVARKSPR
jgi:hypothetical protein